VTEPIYARDDAEAEADAELKDDAYMLSLLLESTTSTKTRTDDDMVLGRANRDCQGLV
jgi:hypothetical protein